MQPLIIQDSVKHLDAQELGHLLEFSSRLCAAENSAKLLRLAVNLMHEFMPIYGAVWTNKHSSGAFLSHTLCDQVQADNDSLSDENRARYMGIIQKFSVSELGDSAGVTPPVEGTFRVTDVMPLQMFHGSDLYNMVYRPFGVKYFVYSRIKSENSLVESSSICLYRLEEDFTEKEMHLLRACTVVANQQYQRLFQQENLAAMSLEKSDEWKESEVLVVSPEMVVCACSPRAFQRFSAEDGTLLIPESLAELIDSIELKEEGARLDFEDAKGNNVQGSLIFDRTSGNRLLVISSEAENPKDVLTKREYEVFCYIGQGKSNWEIAKICGISERTIEKHCQRIYEKLELENRYQVIANYH